MSKVVQNEFNTPIEGTPDISKIVEVDELVGSDWIEVFTLEYQLFWDEQYQYIFTPNWNNIDKIIETQGWYEILGLNLDLRLEKYYRVNMTPSFVVNNSPSKNRQDVVSLMRDVGLDYYDRMEWMVRTKLKLGSGKQRVRGSN